MIDEVNNRVSCIERQQEKFDEGTDEVYGIKELSGSSLDTNLKYFDLN